MITVMDLTEMGKASDRKLEQWRLDVRRMTAKSIEKKELQVVRLLGRIEGIIDAEIEVREKRKDIMK